MRFINSVFFICFCIITSFAQAGLKIAYVDMDYILDNVPEYRQASSQLDSKAQQWRTEIEIKQNDIDKLKDELESERPLLTVDLIQDLEDEIEYLENQLLEYRNKRFGVSGDFIVQKRQLIQPIQDQVFNAIQEIGDNRDYDFIFENSADALLLFSAKRHDLSEVILKLINRNSRGAEKESSDVLEEIGDYKSVEKAEEEEVKKEEKAQEEEARKDERESLMDDRQIKRDSLRDVRQREFEERRAKILKQREEREKERDSIRKARENN